MEEDNKQLNPVAPKSEERNIQKQSDSTGQTTRTSTKEKASIKNPTEDKNQTDTMLTKIGKTAIKEHKLTQAFVTRDGVAFAQLNDARNHAANLSDDRIVTVKNS